MSEYTKERCAVQNAARKFSSESGRRNMEPMFNQGALLIFNSELLPKNKDFVIFYDLTTKEVYFRQYVVDGKDTYLKAFDAMYSVFKNTQFNILGVLVESRNTFK